MSLAQHWHDFFDRPAPNLALRTMLMLVGLAATAFGASLSRATGLGTGVISCVPAVLSFMTPVTMGTYTFFFNMLFILVQVILLRRDYKPLQLLCIPYVAVFSAQIDLFTPLCESLPMSCYAACLAFTLLSCVSTAVGVWLQVHAALVMLPGDGVVLTISKVFSTDFAKTKIAFDSTLVVTGVVLSLASMGGLFGVREGTIVAAFLVGSIIGALNRAFPHFERFAPVEGHLTLTPKEQAPETGLGEERLDFGKGSPLVVTVARQYGAGGREIAQAVGDLMGVRTYDRSLVDMVAREAGLDADYVRDNEQDVRHGILYSLYAQNYQYVGALPSRDDALFLAQARTITNLADHGSCVIVGRGADQVLKGRENVFTVFVSAPIEARISRVMRREGAEAGEARRRIERIDAERAAHARLFLGHEWGGPDYDLHIDSTQASAQELAQVILDAAHAGKGVR